MAYSDYGAFVYLNGERRRDKEDVAAFATDEETFGESSDNIPSGLRIWASLLKQKKDNSERSWLENIHHGIMGDGNIRVICHKQGLPMIYEATDNGINEVVYPTNDIDYYDYDTVEYTYKGHKFKFESNKPYYAKMVTPDGDIWECWYDYEYGAGYEDDGITDKECEDEDK